MLLVTTDSIPGHRIDAVLGDVMGLVAQSTGFDQALSAGMRSYGRGEITEYTQVMFESRQRMIEDAAGRRYPQPFLNVASTPCGATRPPCDRTSGSAGRILGCRCSAKGPGAQLRTRGEPLRSSVSKLPAVVGAAAPALSWRP